MFKQIDNCLKEEESYIVMGQICVDKQFRKQGVFRGLYHFMKQEMASKYNMIITEVDIANTRSLNAHYAIDFKTLYSYRYNHQDWKILYLNLKN
jgi:hypothetical protein